MSLLVDKLKQVSKAAPQPMGFRTDKSASPKLQMLLIASLNRIEAADGLADSLAGADAVLLNMREAVRQPVSPEKTVQSLPDIPWGIWLEETGKKRKKTASESGNDFVLFSTTSSVLSVPQDEKVGRILHVELSLSDSLLKAINELPVDAVLASVENEGNFTWHQLMSIQRLTGSLNKPVLVSIPSIFNADELKAIWETGVDGVIAEVDPGQPVERVKELRKAIDGLNSLPPRKRGNANAIIPYMSGKPDTIADIEEDDDDDDDDE